MVIPSGNKKHMADSREGMVGAGGRDKVRLSPYVRRSASRGSKLIRDAGDCRSSITQTPPSSANLIVPQTCDRTLEVAVTTAATFVNSVASLCSKSDASCGVMSEPFPREDIFLYLVSLCGVVEAKHWADVMGFAHDRSYALLSRLMYGPNQSRTPRQISPLNSTDFRTQMPLPTSDARPFDRSS
jgi:hypothetical protein